jgi:hypothetical protein
VPGNGDRQVEDLGLVELLAQALEEIVVDAGVIERKPFRELDRDALSAAVFGTSRPRLAIGVEGLGDSLARRRRAAKVDSYRAVVDPRDAVAHRLAHPHRQYALLVDRGRQVVSRSAQLWPQLPHTRALAALTVRNVDPGDR